MNKPPIHDFVDLHFKSFGTGKPLVILHGLFGSLDNWQTIGKFLSHSFTIYLLDLRNHGKSPHTNQMNFRSMAWDVYEFCKKNNLHSIYLLGHSLGGKVALTLLDEFEALIEKIMVLDIAPKEYPRVHDALFHAMNSLPLDKLRLRAEVDAYLEKSIPDSTIRQFLLKNLERDSAGSFTWKMNLPILQNQYASIQEAIYPNHLIQKEVLFVKGERSNYILAEDEVQIKKYYPKAKFHTILNAGHWVHADNPQAVCHLIIEYFNSK